MTRPMTDSEICDMIQGLDGAVSEAVELIKARIEALEERTETDFRRLWDHIARMPGGV